MNKLNESDVFGFNMDSRCTNSNFNNTSAKFNDSSMTNKKFGAIIYDEKTKVVIFSMGPKLYFINT